MREAWVLLQAILIGGQDSVRARVYVQALLNKYTVSGTANLSDRHQREGSLAKLRLAGERLSFEWGRIEAVRGTRNWATMDSIIAELDALHLKYYGLLTFSPGWAVPPGLTKMPRIDSHRPVVDGSSARGDTLFAAFAGETARRYRGRVDRWEVWNEENNPDFWFNVADGVNRGPQPDDYERLFDLARDSILAANPNAQVAVGGLASFSGRTRSWPDQLGPGRTLSAEPSHIFLRRLLGLGLRPAAVSIHPYSTVPPGLRRPGESVPVFPDQVIDSVFSVLDEVGLRRTPVWVTEWGVDVRPDMKSASVLYWFSSALSYMLCRPRIKFITIHALTDEHGTTHFGLFNLDGTRTEAGRAVASVLDSWTGCQPSRSVDH